jgi:tetratricopeptide (TPR) repeat protein
MKKMKFALLAVVCSMSLALFAQKPIDPVIAKFNDGVAKVNAGDFKTAIADFEEVLTLPETAEAKKNDLRNKAKTQLPVLYYQVANGLINQKKYEEAIPGLRKTVELADLYGNNGPTKEKAIKFLPQLLTGVGSQKLKEKDLPAALSNFNEAIKYDASYAKAYLGKGKVYADQFKEKDMLENLSKATELAKAAADQKTAERAQAYLGEFYVNQGNINLADVDPENPDYSPAIASFEKAVSYNPAAADAYYMLAVIWNKSVEFDKALGNCKKALESETDATKIAAINYELGNAYFGNAEYPLACEAFNKALIGPFAEKAQAKKEKVPGCQ